MLLYLYLYVVYLYLYLCVIAGLPWVDFHRFYFIFTQEIFVQKGGYIFYAHTHSHTHTCEEGETQQQNKRNLFLNYIM